MLSCRFRVCVFYFCAADSGTDEAIPLPNVKVEILKKVVEYCTHHKDNPAEEIAKPLKTPNLEEVRRAIFKWGLVMSRLHISWVQVR